MKLMAESLDTVGVMARSVADCALLIAAVTGLDLGDPDRKPDCAPRVGVCRSPVWPHAAPETQELFDRVPGVLARAGAEVRDFDLPAGFAALETAHPIIMNVESARALGWEMSTAREQISAQLREKLEWGLAQPASALVDARIVFRRLQDEFDAIVQEFDFILTPSAPGVAPAGIEWTGDPVFNYIWTSLHVPCVTVPAGAGPGGMPLGVQIVSGRTRDREALAWAAWVGAALES
jgi:Asp-tRNA(Asn)/Glu-tRNA(Gln) amidotransferase A subunit family amidase